MNAQTQYAPFAGALVVGLLGFALGDWSLMAFMAAAAIACAGVVLQSNRYGILATSVLGLGCSGYLFSRKLESATGPALCNVSEVINCDVVNNSAASEIFGIPIALLGSGFFLGLAVAALLARELSARLAATTLMLSSVGCLYSLYLAFESQQLGAVCIMCVTIYLCCGILLWAGIRGIAESGETFAQQLPSIFGSTSFVSIAAVGVIVVLVGQSTWTTKSASNPALPEITGSTAPTPTPETPTAPTPPPGAGTPPAPAGQLEPAVAQQYAQLYADVHTTIPLEGNEPILGDPDAPYMVVEFADFGCPHCADAAVMFKQLVQQEPDIQVRFRPFALSGACNPALQSKEGADRCRAAMAAECAHEQGKFWEYSSLVFAGQPDLSDPTLQRAALDAALDIPRWEACWSNPETVQIIARHAVAGARAGVHGTPALFLKGVKGDQFVDVCMGPQAILALVNLHKQGIPLPEASQPTCHDDH